jgi:outer membrane biosynthesis protein TonB
MRGLASRLLTIAIAALLTACAAETKPSAPAQQAKPTPPPAPAAPAAKAPPPAQPQRPALTPAPARQAPPPPPAVAQQPAPAPPPAPAPAPQEAQKSEAPQTLTISVGRANMREKPDTKSKIVQVLTKGTKVTVVSKGDQWFRVKLTDGTEGWVAESVVSPATN